MPRKSLVKLTDNLDMTKNVDLDVKQQNNNNGLLWSFTDTVVLKRISVERAKKSWSCRFFS